MSEGNKRYLGDVFINEDNYEVQKQFFRDIIESYQWKYGGIFDASSLQEKTPEDFATAEQGGKADLAILAPLKIGGQNIENIQNPQYIYTDGVIIDKGSGDEASQNYIQLIEWFNSLPDTASLSQLLYTIYSKVINLIENLKNTKVDKSDYQQFISTRFNPLEETINEVTEEVTAPDGSVSKKLNAHFVNGLRLRLVTQAQYDNLSESEKNYWRDIFIIKDSIPTTYEDPGQLSLTDGYEFRVFNEHLQVKNVLTERWTDICSLEDLFSGSNIRTMIKEITSENLPDILKTLDPATVEIDFDDYPFISSSLHDVYAKDVLINNESKYTTSSLDSTDSLKILNIDVNQILKDNKVLNENGNNAIDSIHNSLSEHDSSINDLYTKSNILNDRISSANRLVTNLNSSLSSIKGNLYNLQTIALANAGDIDTLNDSLDNKLDNSFKLIRRVYGGDEDLWDIRIYSNGPICYIRIYMNITNMNKEYGMYIPTDIGEWPSPRPTLFPLDDSYPEAAYRPVYPVSALDLSGDVMFALRENDQHAALFFKSMTGSRIYGGQRYASLMYMTKKAIQ